MAQAFDHGLAEVTVDSKYAYINKKGKFFWRFGKVVIKKTVDDESVDEN